MKDVRKKMAEIDKMSLLLLKIIRPMVVLALVFCFIKMIYSEESKIYRSRALKILKYYIYAESLFEIRKIILFYFT